MTRRMGLALAAVALLAAATFGVSFSGAFFQDTDTTPQKVSADEPANVLHLYSQMSDPQGRTGFAVKPGTTDPIATGTSTALSVDVGHRTAAGAWPDFDRAFVLSVPATLPAGVSSVKVTATIVDAAGHSDQPIQSATLSALDGTPTTNPETLNAGDERQVNLRIDTTGLGAATLYHAFVVLRLDYPDGSFMHYRVPVDVCTAVGGDC